MCKPLLSTFTGVSIKVDGESLIICFKADRFR